MLGRRMLIFYSFSIHLFFFSLSNSQNEYKRGTSLRHKIPQILIKPRAINIVNMFMKYNIYVIFMFIINIYLCLFMFIVNIYLCYVYVYEI